MSRISRKSPSVHPERSGAESKGQNARGPGSALRDQGVRHILSLRLRSLRRYAQAERWAARWVAPALVLLFGALALAAATPAKPLSVTTALDKPKVQLGEPFQYTVTITHAPDQRYEVVPPRDLGSFELLHLDRSRKDENGRSTTTFTLKLSLFALGPQQLPPLDFEETDATGVHPFTQPGAKVEGVPSLPPDAAKKGEALFDIKPNEQVAVRSWRLLWILLSILGVAVLGFILYRGYQKLKARAAMVPPVPPRPLRERTLDALETLKREAPHRQGKVREFYFRLSEILRGYLGERYRFDALECTSPELITRVRGLTDAGFPLGDFSAFVHESDLAKYAKAELPPDTCEGALGFAFKLVEVTHPPAVVPANASGPDVPQP